jgi:serine/tyrosine/threonine adenylyltransferase
VQLTLLKQPARLIGAEVDVACRAFALGLQPAQIGVSRYPGIGRPIAMAYAGHQFGGFVPQLGDGRAILLGEVIDRDGRRRDIQLKGAGRTPFSRGGDGRPRSGRCCANTSWARRCTRWASPPPARWPWSPPASRCSARTPLPGAVLTRVAASHIRVGTFQYFAARGDRAAVQRLADYAIARHDPELADAAEPLRGALAAVAARQGELVARWMAWWASSTA